VGIGPTNLRDLQLKWSIAIPGATEMRSQPVAASGALFLGTSNGNLLALDQDSGCVIWRFQPKRTIRSSLNLERAPDGTAVIFFADDLANVYAVSANDGTLRWTSALRWFPTSVISGSLTYHDDILYVPMSSFEVAIAGFDQYPCCRSHGGVASLDASSGELVWEYRTTPHARLTGKNSLGTDQWGPSGASIWTTPAIDAKRGVLYVGSGENTSHPATDSSDAVIALDLASGERRWNFQALAGDVWNAACIQGGANCPADAGPDFDFGGGLTLAESSDGRELLIAGQKSGEVFALDPDRDGELVWKSRLSMGTTNGGIHWGVATDSERVYVTVADPPRAIPDYVPNPGVFALHLANGEPAWALTVERGCQFDPADIPRVGLAAMQDASKRNPWPECSFYYGHSAAPMLANGVVYAGALDGKLRMIDASSGRLLSLIDTQRAYAADNGIEGHGGAIDLSGVVVDGNRLFISSGYGMFGQMPGNVFLAYELAKRESPQTASRGR
jgi:polyvinyl alcohol dehydrogenase (cytochrome)